MVSKFHCNSFGGLRAVEECLVVIVVVVVCVCVGGGGGGGGGGHIGPDGVKKNFFKL